MVCTGERRVLRFVDGECSSGVSEGWSVGGVESRERVRERERDGDEVDVAREQKRERRCLRDKMKREIRRGETRVEILFYSSFTKAPKHSLVTNCGLFISLP